MSWTLPILPSLFMYVFDRITLMLWWIFAILVMSTPAFAYDRFDLFHPHFETSRILFARYAAFSAASIPTVATGTRGGICTIESNESNPPSALLTGTPMTGLVVRDAIKPGRAAAKPAIAMKTFA